MAAEETSETDCSRRKAGKKPKPFLRFLQAIGALLLLLAASPFCIAAALVIVLVIALVVCALGVLIWTLGGIVASALLALLVTLVIFVVGILAIILVGIILFLIFMISWNVVTGSGAMSARQMFASVATQMDKMEK
ncbi:MAG: hypothetical protein JWO84_792 [Parcubacteria group bacterium]|nr:hypothetical protein [Parcubacteria group bacterium]